MYDNITIDNKANTLKMHFSNHPDLIGKLEHIQNENYLCTYSLPTREIVEIPLTIENNKVTGLTPSVDPFIEFTNYQFKKIN